MIAIIGILAAIIIPTVGKVRESARASQCLSNLRQVSMAFGLYANDNKGALPRSNVPVSWQIAIKNYLPINGNVVNNKVYLCPSAPQPPEGYDQSVTHFPVSFVVEAGNSATTASGSGGNGPRNLSTVPNPSRAILLVDGWVNPTTYRASNSRTYTLVKADFDQPTYTDESAFRSVSFRHGGNMNAAYVDGHAARIPWVERYNAIPDAQTWAGRR